MNNIATQEQIVGLRFDGEVHTLTQWTQKLGLKGNILRERFNHGWSINRTLTTPARSYGGEKNV